MRLNKKNRKIIESCNEVKQVCSPLFDNFKLSYFSYVQIYKERSQIILGSNASWIEHYIRNDCFNSDMAQTLEGFNAGSYLWKGLNGDNRFRIQRESFNIDNGIIIINEFSNFREYINFATTRSDVRANNFFLNNMDVIDSFIHYFRNKADPLIREIKNECVIVPDDKRTIEICDDPNLIYNIDKRNAFFKKIHENQKPMTKRETQCLLYLVQGMTAKQMAKKLHLSYRTIEEHIANIKSKLGCKTKAELIKTFYQKNIFSYLTIV